MRERQALEAAKRERDKSQGPDKGQDENSSLVQGGADLDKDKDKEKEGKGTDKKEKKHKKKKVANPLAVLAAEEAAEANVVQG